MNRVRVVLCGEASVGKSSILNRFSTGVFNSTLNSTVAGAFHTQYVRVNGQTVSLEIWDTAGCERYHSVIPSFFKNAAAVVIVYDVTKRDTFENLDFWVNFSRNNAPEKVNLFIVANKVDLFESRQVKYDEGKGFSDHHECAGFEETSAKTGEGIENLFAMLAAVPPNGTVDVEVRGEVIELDKKPSCC